MNPWWKNRASSQAEEDEVVLPVAEGDTTPAADPAPSDKEKEKDTAKDPKNTQASASHPVLTAALAAGITTAAHFEDMHTVAKAARQDLQARAEKQAIRCFGPEAGPKRSSKLESASYEDAKSMTDLWQETADAKFGIGAEGAARISDAPDPNEAPPAATALTPEEHEEFREEGRKGYANMRGQTLTKS